MHGLSDQALQVLRVIVDEADSTCGEDGDVSEDCYPDDVVDDLVARGCCVAFYCDFCQSDHGQPTRLGRVAAMLGSLK